MWDEPQALRKLSNTLFGIAAVLLLFGALDYALHLPVFALRTVQLDAVPQRVDVADVKSVVRNELRGNFFTVDLEQTRRDFEKLPWVRKVDVRRHFPWQLDVKLEEQVALAHWNGSQLVNTDGEVFDANTAQALPSLSGPDGSAAAVAQRYTRFSEMLSALGQQIAKLSLSPRGAWQLRLQDGLRVELGREQMEQRLARFVAVYPYSLGTMQQPTRYVDLRYRNGFAAYLPAAHGKG
jgi:cell division protein FtsQ